MPKKSKKKKSGAGKIILQYVLLWPALRNYIMWFKYFRHRKKGKKKEKVIIIE